MKTVRNVIMWLFMLTKRLYKKPSFLALLILVTVLAFGYGLAAREQSGMLTIALSCEDQHDVHAQSLIDALKDSSNVINFTTGVSADIAKQMVFDGAADAAWIIGSDFGAQISDYVSGTYTGRGFVSVIVREETVPLMLAKEKLSGKLFVACARAYFLHYFRQNVPEAEGLSDQKILAHYDHASLDENLFVFSYVNGEAVDTDSLNYLLMPLRGIFAVFLLIGGMAGAMFYTSDYHQGLFSWVSLKRKSFVELGYLLIVLTNLAVAVIFALWMSDVWTNLLQECLSMVLYIMCCSVFCQLLRMLCRSSPILAMVLPILSVMALVICPVFISLPGLSNLQFVLPPTYYIHSIYNPAYLLYMLVYTIIVKLLYEICCRFLNKL